MRLSQRRKIILPSIFNCKHFVPQLDRGIHSTFLPDLFEVFFPILALEDGSGFAL